MTTKIVADSTADIPPDIARRLEITVVPVYINAQGQSYRENIDITREEFYKNLPDYIPYPTTAAPSIATFSETFERLAGAGADEIVAIILASNLSATYNAARLGAEAANANVALFDSQQITLGSGFLVMMAAEMAQNGRSGQEILAMLQKKAAQTRLFGVLNTLESLRRSGRVNWATFGVGSLLKIKPILMIHQGEVSIVARVRTQKRAVRELLQTVETLAPFERLAVIHINAPEAANELRLLAAHLFPADQPQFITEVTPAVGLHLGVGAVGFVCISKE